MFFNILIVDDEEHVTDALSSLIETQSDIDCDVHTAQSAEQALQIIEKERIDLLISDIRMSGMDGLTLVDTVSKQWPMCRSIMLTGYSDFNSVYRAMQLKTAGFLLKTENDEQILMKIREVLSDIEARLNQKALLSTVHIDQADERIGQALSAPADQRRRLLLQMGVDPLRPMALCLCTVGKNKSNILDAFIRYYIQFRFHTILCWPLLNDKQTLWLIQNEYADISPSIISTLMETVQNSFRTTVATEFSCVIGFTDADQMPEVFQKASEALIEPTENMSSVTLLTPLEMQQRSTDYTIQFLKKYIVEHIAEDVSIPTLARVTGYNADYLSRIFRNFTGTTIGQYITDVRFSMIRRMMLDSDVSFDDMARQTGFSNRAYFNRFIKRSTGMSPRDWRLYVQENESGNKR